VKTKTNKKQKIKRNKMLIWPKHQKRAWVRVLESIISILILLGLFTFFISKQVQPFSAGSSFSELGYSLLQEVIQNTSLVSSLISCNDNTCVALNDARTVVGNRLEQMRMTNIGFNLSLSNSSILNAPLLPENTDVYAESQIIESSSEKKLVVYLWQKK